MCGILGVLLADTAEQVRLDLHDGLTALQHRGQDSAGFLTCRSDGRSPRFYQVKGEGLVRDVLTTEAIESLRGNMGVGHVRYPTAGSRSKASMLLESQPMYLNYPCGIALAHNGNLTNRRELLSEVRSNHRHINSQSDSEVLLNVFAEELRIQIDSRDGPRSARLTTEMIFESVKATMEHCRGGYSVVMIVDSFGLVCFRDPHGIRPLSIGKRKSKTLDGGIDYCFTSESVACDTLGYEMVRDVRPGECALVLPMVPDHPRENLGLFSKKLVGDDEKPVPCLFEYVYFARPDSIMDGVSVYEARLKMGEKLAVAIRKKYPDEKIDVVIPIPDTSRTAALALATFLGVPYRDGFVKNRYIARSFILPDQKSRRKAIRLKLNTVKPEFKDRNVLLVDDSIVRGTTSTEIVRMARDAGAKKVFFGSASPVIRHANVYGIDIADQQELISHERTVEQIAERIGCEWVVFQDLPDLEDAVRSLNPVLEAFEGSPFSGKYITNDVDEAYLKALALERRSSIDLM